jgi:hypothetical protein
LKSGDNNPSAEKQLPNPYKNFIEGKKKKSSSAAAATSESSPYQHHPCRDSSLCSVVSKQAHFPTSHHPQQSIYDTNLPVDGTECCHVSHRYEMIGRFHAGPWTFMHVGLQLFQLAMKECSSSIIL